MHSKWSTFDLAFGAVGFIIGMIAAHYNAPAISWMGGGMFGLAVAWYGHDKQHGR